MNRLKTPVLFTIFNRPTETARVFAEIRKQKPLQLFIAADGPRNEAEKMKIEETRAIVSNIDWPCEVRRKFESKNLGCKMAMSGAINWFFENVEEGIILEDDCLPHPDFFRFCSELLSRYRDNNKIMMITGDNFQDGIKRGPASYYFSKFDFIWGWASWRRAWQHYDVAMSEFDRMVNENWVAQITSSGWAQKSILRRMQEVKDGLYDTWDFQWRYSILKNNGLTVHPNVNLISNIGHGENATHTKKFKKDKALLKTEALGPIVHPQIIERNSEADEYMTKKFHPFNLRNYLGNIARSILGKNEKFH